MHEQERFHTMIFRKVLALLTIVFVFLFATSKVFAGNQENPLTRAIWLFDEGQFNEAEVILKKLLEEKPDHLMVNYYYGACRTENGHYGTNEIIYLLNGSLGESPLLTDYYIGIQYHAKNRWEEALKHYRLFEQKTDTATAQRVGLAEKMRMCQNNINPFVSVDESADTINEPYKDIHPTALERETEPEAFTPVIDTTIITSEEIDSTESFAKTDSTGVDSLIGHPTTANIHLAKKETEVKTEPINFVVNAEITYPDTTFFKTKNGLKLYIEGSAKQHELEQIIGETNELRKEYGTASSIAERNILGEKILKKETTIFELREKAEELLLKAQQEENAYWQNASFKEKQEFNYQVETYMATVNATTKEILPDSIILPPPSIFQTRRIKENKLQEETADELVYKIQIGAYSRGLPAYVERLFKKLSYIRKIENYTDENGVVVYTTGNLTNYEDARRMQEQVRQEGIEDAYVVPYFNGKRITLREAKEMENE